tara:strand:+ start:51 stop:614 length:564 start_codon:yes stop_codon:yes gene_type:complete
MSTIFNGLRELMWFTINVKKSDILNNDENFLINKANELIENESFRLFSANIDYDVDIDGISLKVDFKKEEPKLNTKADEMRIDVYEILENSSVYSPDLIKPENLELKIDTKQDTSIYGYGHEVFNDSEYKFHQNNKELNLVLESESNGPIDRKLLYVKDQNENFAIDLTDDLDVKEMYLELKKYLKN